MHEFDVKWRAWSEYDLPDISSRPIESHAVVPAPLGHEIASSVVWQQASNNNQGLGLWTEDAVVVEILEPQEFAGHYRVEIDFKVTTSGREMTTAEVQEEYAGLA